MKIMQFDITEGFKKGNIIQFEGDNKNESYKIILLKNKNRYSLINKTVKIVMINKETKKGDYFGLEILNAEKGEIEINVTDKLTKEDGFYICQLVIDGLEGFKENSVYFDISIKKSLINEISGEIIADPSFKILTDAIAKVEEWNMYFEETSGAIEEKYTNRLNISDVKVEELVDEQTIMKNDIKELQEKTPDNSFKPKKAVGVFTKDSSWIPKLKDSIKKSYDIGCEVLLLSVTIVNNFDTNNPSIGISLAEIRDLVRYSEGLGFKVTLKCHNLGEYDGQGNQKQPENPAIWFKNYNTLVVSIADIAQEFKHTHFLISNEMHNVSNITAWKSYWVIIINNVKMRGLKVGSSVNNPEMWENDGYQLFKELDFYGFNLYPTLSFKPYKEAEKNMKDLYKAFFLDPRGVDYIPTLQGFSQDGKEMWITECGCMPTDKGLELPAYWGDGSLPYNEEVQKIYYEAMIPMFYNCSCVDVMAIWCGNEEDPFGFIGKQAETVVRKYWGDKLSDSQQPILPTSIRLTPENLTLAQGESQQLTAIILPENSTNKTVTWKSSNLSAVSIKEIEVKGIGISTNGLVTALSSGISTVTVTTSNGISANCMVNVTPPR